MTAGRVNAPLPRESARTLAYLERRLRKTTTEIVVESISRYYDALTQSSPSAAAEALARSGFVACADGPPHLSESYKAELARGLLLS
jgi:hypothetical protein